MGDPMELSVTVCESAATGGLVKIIRDASELDYLTSFTGEDLDHELRRARGHLGDSALHLAVRFSNTAVTEHLVRHRSDLVKEVNDELENSLHLVARLGNARMAALLLAPSESEMPRGAPRNGRAPTQISTAAKEALRAQNRFGETPAHEAVRTRNVMVAKTLVRADPTLAQHPNRYGESLLYLAAERGMESWALWLLTLCTSQNISPCYRGAKGETALHAAVKSWKGQGITMLLKHEPKLALLPNDHGDVPLHYVAYLGKQHLAQRLLCHDPSWSCGYAQNNAGNCAIHMAAMGGHHGVVDLLATHCPNSENLVNKQGWNALHVAIQHEHLTVVKHILRHPRLDGLVYQRDNDGNSALHVAAKYCNARILRVLLGDGRLDSMARNCSHKTALDVFLEDDKADNKTLQWAEALKMLTAAIPRLELDTVQEEDAGLRRRKEAKARFMAKVDEERKSAIQLAALISAVTFAAAFTVPGGYNNGPPGAGLPVLLHQLAFKVFVVSDTATMCCSLAVLFLCGYATWDDIDFVKPYWYTILVLMWAAFVGMTVSFATGMYTIINPEARVLSMVTNFICYGIPAVTLVYARWPIAEMRIRLLTDGLRRMHRRWERFDRSEWLHELKALCFNVYRDKSIDIKN